MSQDITREEAAEILGIDPVLLERRVRAGRLTCRGIDGKITFDRAEVMALKEIEAKRHALMVEIHEALDDSGEMNSKGDRI